VVRVAAQDAKGDAEAEKPAPEEPSRDSPEATAAPRAVASSDVDVDLPEPSRVAPDATAPPAAVASSKMEVLAPAPMAAADAADTAATAPLVQDLAAETTAADQQLMQREKLYLQTRHVKKEVAHVRSALDKALRGTSVGAEVGKLLAEAETDFGKESVEDGQELLLAARQLRALDPEAAARHATGIRKRYLRKHH